LNIYLVILVDNEDGQIRELETSEVHIKDVIIKPFSFYILNSKKTMQQRAFNKYHFPLLRTKATCTNFTPEEIHDDVVRHKMKKEMRIENELTEIIPK